jgi:hypothetical protein
MLVMVMAVVAPGVISALVAEALDQSIDAELCSSQAQVHLVFDPKLEWKGLAWLNAQSPLKANKANTVEEVFFDDFLEGRRHFRVAVSQEIITRARNQSCDDQAAARCVLCFEHHSAEAFYKSVALIVKLGSCTVLTVGIRHIGATVHETVNLACAFATVNNVADQVTHNFTKDHPLAAKLRRMVFGRHLGDGTAEPVFEIGSPGMRFTPHFENSLVGVRHFFNLK